MQWIFRWWKVPHGDRSRGVVAVASRGLEDAPRGHQPVTEDDEASHRASRPITLKDHTCAVVRYVERFAATLGLMADQGVAELHLAGRVGTTSARRMSDSSSCSSAPTGGIARTVRCWPRAAGRRRVEPRSGPDCHTDGGTRRGQCAWP